MLELIDRNCSGVSAWEAFDFAFDCPGFSGIDLNRGDERNAKIFLVPGCDDKLPTDAYDLFRSVTSDVYRNDHY